MKGNFSTEYGRIAVDEKVIAKMAGLTAIECFGIVGMAALSKTDGIVKLLTRDKLTRGIHVDVRENKVYLDFHVIVVFGMTISAIADNLISSVKYTVEDITGLKVGGIRIFVDGVRVID